jgi:hypothetical protein
VAPVEQLIFFRTRVFELQVVLSETAVTGSPYKFDLDHNERLFTSDPFCLPLYWWTQQKSDTVEAAIIWTDLWDRFLYIRAVVLDQVGDVSFRVGLVSLRIDLGYHGGLK